MSRIEEKPPLEYAAPEARGGWLSRTADEMGVRPWVIVAVMVVATLLVVGFSALLIIDVD